MQVKRTQLTRTTIVAQYDRGVAQVKLLNLALNLVAKEHIIINIHKAPTKIYNQITIDISVNKLAVQYNYYLNLQL